MTAIPWDAPDGTTIYLLLEPIPNTRNLWKPCLVVNLDNRVHGRIELISRLEEGELDDEEVLERLAAQLCYEFARRLCRSACKAADLY